MKKLLLIPFILFIGYIAKAQTRFTADELDSYLNYTPDKLKSILNLRGYNLSNRTDLPKELQCLYISKSDINKRVAAIFYGATLGILTCFGDESEQKYYKASLKAEGYKFKENAMRDGYPSTKYIKDGGLREHGLEVELYSTMNSGRKYYPIFLWNWRDDSKTITNLSELPNPVEASKSTAKTKKYLVLHHKGQEIFNWYKVHYKAVTRDFDTHGFTFENSCVVAQLGTDGTSVILSFSNECD